MAKATDSPSPGFIGRMVRGVFRLVWGFCWRIALVVVLITGTATAYFYSGLPASDDLFDGRGVGSVTLRDTNNQIFAWRGEQYGGDLTVDDVSPHLLNAVIATEDKRFYDHYGIDPRGIARAMYANLKAGRLVQGGSTLTQQVAKNVFLDAQRNIERKVKEVPMALALELKYSKKEILSVYLNRVYLGAGTYGFEAAAQRYFGKSARVVNAAESAMLAGLLRAPSRLAPTRDLARSQNRARVIIRLMREQGHLTDAEADQALENPAVLSEAAAARAGGAFADWMLEGGGEDGFLSLLKGADVEIETTFDPKLQQMAEEALAEVFETKVREGSEAEA
ncbi:MAG: transglycosylase domain-containing protein, partial [Pseudomonadota bacterium]